MMRFFGFGKKQTQAVPEQPSSSQVRQDTSPSSQAGTEIVVYGTSDGSRCRQARALLDKHGHPYKDVRIDHDLSTRSWLQRTTGDNALPKVFIGATWYGGFEDLQVLMFDGTWARLLSGEASLERPEDPATLLKQDLSVEALTTLLRQGEILTITEGGMEMDAWAEPLANPPLVYYEGTPYPIADLEGIAAQIITRVKAGDIEIRWKEDD